MNYFKKLFQGKDGLNYSDFSKFPIIQGEGWSKVRLLALKKNVDAFLGEEGNLTNKYKEVYFVDYIKFGLGVSYRNKSNQVQAIFFYNNDDDSERFSIYPIKTEKNIDWHSSETDVEKSYGLPLKKFTGNNAGKEKNIAWIRMVYKGIDFRFMAGKMVRIGITIGC